MQKESERGFNQPTKKPNISPEIDRIIGRIKPSIETRDKCFLARHIRCFTEVSAAPPKWLRSHKADSSPAYKTKRKRRMRKAGDNKEKELLKSSKGMGSSVAQTLMTDENDEEAKIICPFDSEVNLSGVVLTPNDKKIIEKNRRKYYQSREKKK